MDKLSALLSRVRSQIARESSLTSQRALKKQLKSKWKRKAEEQNRIAEDYAQRLAERARFRRLLADEAQDGLRFRWYFEHIENSIPLDQLRSWIDAKMLQSEAKEKKNVA